MRLLMPALDDPRVQAVCEYSEAAGTAEWLIRYPGRPLDIPGAEDQLALTVLQGMTEIVDHTRDDGAPLPNLLRLRVRR